MKDRGPEQWHARVLAEESERLTAAVRILEWRDGYVCAGGQLAADLNPDMLVIRDERGPEVGAEAARLAALAGPDVFERARA